MDVHVDRRSKPPKFGTLQYYRLVVENLTEYAVVTLDPSGVVRSWNKGAERLLGWSMSEAIGKYTNFFFTPEDCVNRIPGKELREAMKNGRSEDERWHVRKDGSLFWGRGVVMPMYSDHQLAGFIKVFRDRTEKREHETRKDEFVIRASHELRTPLSIIKLNTEYLLGKGVHMKREERTEALKTINEQTDRLTTLVSDLLDLSKILAGKLSPRKEFFSLAALVRDVAKQMSPALADSRIIFVHAEDVELFADRQQIAQVLVNLIGNALKYSRPTSPVELAIVRSKDTVTTCISDRGM